MLRERINLIRRLNMAIDLLITGVSFLLAYSIRKNYSGEGLVEIGPLTDFLWILLIVLPIWLLLFTLHGAYYSKRTTPVISIIWMVLRVVFWGGIMLFAALYVFKSFLVSRWFIGAFLVSNAVLLSVEKIAIMSWLHTIRKKGYNFRTVLIVGLGDRLKEVKDKIDQHPGWGMNVIGFVAIEPTQTNPTTYGVNRLGVLEDLPALIHQHVIDEVIFAIPIGYIDRIEDAIRVCEEQGIKSQIAMHFYTPTIAKTYVEDMDGLPMLTYSTTPEDVGKLFCKRAFDLTGALLGLIIISPLLLIISLGVRISSSGPVFFKQNRIGLNGRVFWCYKFRSMVQNAEALQDQLETQNELSGPVFKIKKDPRVTTIGYWLRKYSLDELPQLYNVLRGDLSLIGPRPAIVDEVRRYEPWQRRRLSMRPGITGIWQVEGRSRIAEFDERVKLDLQYIDNWSLTLDMKILLKTIPTVLSGRGAH
ncbi:MAG TPA: sugar transferase [candidate division Zixibacteria bacterium]|nr:sugar transferase [candidate division Zixibacteria bacterium]